jgi:hypothetical protein
MKYCQVAIVRVQNEFPGRSLVEVAITLRCVVQRDDRCVDGFGDLDFVAEDRIHETTVVSHHRALTGSEGVRLRPTESDADAQRPDLGGLVDTSRVTGHVEAGDAQTGARLRNTHDRVEHGGWGFMG